MCHPHITLFLKGRIAVTFSTPAENLAADEVLLDQCEAGGGEETLLFWEPRETFVVVGYANKVASEVNVPACEAKGIPIFRRCSGGGTVVPVRAEASPVPSAYARISSSR